jgi:hypothetical protein
MELKRNEQEGVKIRSLAGDYCTTLNRILGSAASPSVRLSVRLWKFQEIGRNGKTTRRRLRQSQLDSDNGEMRGTPLKKIRLLSYPAGPAAAVVMGCALLLQHGGGTSGSHGNGR